MTPAIDCLTEYGVMFSTHEYQITAPTGHYGPDAARALGVPAERVFKTLLVCLNDQAKALAVCVLPVSTELNLKLAAKAHGAKKAQMADPALAEKATGYLVGGISPFGQKRTLPMVLDDSALTFETIFTSAGRRNLEIEFDPKDLIRTLNVKTAPLSR